MDRSLLIARTTSTELSSMLNRHDDDLAWRHACEYDYSMEMNNIHLRPDYNVYCTHKKQLASIYSGVKKNWLVRMTDTSSTERL